MRSKGVFNMSQCENILLVAPDGRRLSKRDKDLDLGQLRKYVSPEKLIGVLACSAGLLEQPVPISARELAQIFRWEDLQKEEIRLDATAIY